MTLYLASVTFLLVILTLFLIMLLWFSQTVILYNTIRLFYCNCKQHIMPIYLTISFFFFQNQNFISYTLCYCLIISKCDFTSYCKLKSWFIGSRDIFFLIVTQSINNIKHMHRWVIHKKINRIHTKMIEWSRSTLSQTGLHKKTTEHVKQWGFL